MKSAYELAMERLDQSNPVQSLTEEQKNEIAEIGSIYSAKIAERELLLNPQIAEAEVAGDFTAVEQLKKQLAGDRTRLSAEMEEKKNAVRPT
ncbi:MAG TPA: hypothetical protein EYQ50_07730 [Verrucomicrobiales bacterium]|nr:hypothetical protein [Verrucomicrobiales bacterium]HIL69928.1 hypothetical protein [Verrucomicrobiota bacterium]